MRRSTSRLTCCGERVPARAARNNGDREQRQEDGHRHTKEHDDADRAPLLGAGAGSQHQRQRAERRARLVMSTGRKRVTAAFTTASVNSSPVAS